MKKLIIILSLILIFSLVGCKKTDKIDKIAYFRIGISSLGNNYSPYYYQTEGEKVVVELIHERLFSFDENGNIIMDGRIDEPADLKSKLNFSVGSITERMENDGSYKYTISIREDVRTPDGTEITYKDILFDFYYLLDPSYTGIHDVRSLPILGIDEYREGVKDAVKLSDAKAQAQLDLLKISGINLRGESIEIETTRKLTEEELKKLNIFVAPMDYYGNPMLFNIKNNRFGFKKGSITSSQTYKGIGKYQIYKYGNTEMYFRRNSAYYKGRVPMEYIKLVVIRDKIYDDDGYRTEGGDEFYLIDIDELDLSFITLDDTSKEEIKRYNFNLELTGNIISTITLENNLALVYSTKRVKGEALLELNIKNKDDFFNKIEYFSNK